MDTVLRRGGHALGRSALGARIRPDGQPYPHTSAYSSNSTTSEGWDSKGMWGTGLTRGSWCATVRGMKAKEFEVLQRAVEEGVRYGIRRYNKYAKELVPAENVEMLAGHIDEAVLNTICEWFEFEPVEGESSA